MIFTFVIVAIIVCLFSYRLSCNLFPYPVSAFNINFPVVLTIATTFTVVGRQLDKSAVTPNMTLISVCV